MVVIADLPTKYGVFKIYAFSDDLIAIVKGEISEKENVCVRVHSECLTGDSFGSKRCDCGPQLDKSLEIISKEDGLIIYLRPHEGRGIGLLNKIKAYALQDKGMDTVEANHQLGFPSDLRSYEAATEVFNYFKIKSIKLLTNNPDKVKQLRKNGTIVIEHIPLKTEPNKYNKGYLNTKKEKMGHEL